MSTEALRRKLLNLSKEVARSSATIDVTAVRAKLEACKVQVSRPDFWDDSVAAQRQLKDKHFHQTTLTRLKYWSSAISDCETALDMVEESTASLSPEDGRVADGVDLVTETCQELDKLDKDLQQFRLQNLLSGEYDSFPCRLVISSGAGGVEAQDWAEMLLRMYVRWAERQPDVSVRVVDRNEGEEGGVRSAEVEVRGEYAYGLLAGEKGTHRLVRISPFNAQGKRQTSFAAVETMPIIEDNLDNRSIAVLDTILDSDLQVSFMRSSGPGGQNANKVETGVRLKHLPTGLQVRCTQERSQLMNRTIAMRRLQEKLLAVKREQNVATLKEIRGEAVQADFGQQIRNYVLDPYQIVKDLRTQHEDSNVDAVLDGGIEDFIMKFLFQQHENQIEY